MLALLAFGTIGFWFVVAFFIITIITFLEYDNGFGTTLDFLLFVCFLVFVAKINIIPFFFHNPIYLGVGLLGYIVIGSIWSLVKWYQYTNTAVEKYNKRGITDTFQKGMLESNVNPKNNYSTIVFWLSYWPFSLLWALVNQPIRKIYKFIYIQLEKTYNSITNKALSKAIS